jgi:hypothetical protein
LSLICGTIPQSRSDESLTIVKKKFQHSVEKLSETGNSSRGSLMGNISHKTKLQTAIMGRASFDGVSS